MLAKLSTSCLTEKHARLLQLEPFGENHGLPIHPQYAGFKIPYFTLDGKLDPAFFRFRFTQTKPSTGFAAVADEPEKPRRYAQPSGTPCGVYLPPLLSDTWREIALEPTVPLLVTEGELKAAAGCVHLGPTIGLGGVFNWKSKKQHQDFLPILEDFVWADRLVNLCFDSDITTNVMVMMAASHLARALARRGAKVIWTQLPAGPNGKQGLDDVMYLEGVSAVTDAIAQATELGPGIALHELNTEVALVKTTGEIVELATGNVYSASAFTDVVYKNRTYVDFDKKTNKEILKFAAKEWVAWQFRNEVPNIDYEPQEETYITKTGAYNSWYPAGWACVPDRKGTIKPWEDLIARMFEGVQPEHVMWVKRWFAYPLRHPGTKLATALLVWGREQGTGKTMLGETMWHIYGQNYGTVTNLQLGSQFNEWAMNKQFIVGDEISIGDKRHTANALKDMITRTQLRINSKNRKSYMVRDCINYYFTSNHEDAIYLEANDRRVFVHYVNTPPLKPIEYKAYQRWLREEGGAARLFDYLRNEIDLGDFDPQGRAPVTAAKLDMTASGRGDTEDWCVLVKQDPDAVITQPYDLFRTIDLLKMYDPEGKERTKVIGLGKALGAAGVFKVAGGNNSARVDGMRTRFWAVRNSEKYRRIGPTEAKRLYEREREMNPVGVAAAQKFRAKPN